MTEQEVRAEHFRQAEASFRLEGLDSSGDVEYQALRARVISGEMDVDEMGRLLLADLKARALRRSGELALAK